MSIKASLNEVTVFESGDIASFNNDELKIQFNETATANLDNDDVLSDASFNIHINGIEKTLTLEIVNARAHPVILDGYSLKLDFADGYSQTCGIIVKKM